MKDNKKDYIFIDTNIYSQIGFKDILKKLKDISNNYSILIPSIQIHEIQENLSKKYISNDFEPFLNKIKNNYKEDIIKKAEKLLKYIKEFEENSFKELVDFLSEQEVIPFSSENYIGAKNRKESSRPPYTPKNNNNHDYYDSLMWENILYYDKLKSSDLYIYTKDKGFLNKSKNDINELLKAEWKLIQRGELKMYKYENNDSDNEGNYKDNNNYPPDDTLIVMDDEKRANRYINEANSIIEEIENEYIKLISVRINPLVKGEFFLIKFNIIDMIINNIRNECNNISNDIYSNIGFIRSKRNSLYNKIFEYGI